MMEEQQFMVWFGVRNGMLWHCGPEIMVDVMMMMVFLFMGELFLGKTAR